MTTSAAQPAAGDAGAITIGELRVNRMGFGAMRLTGPGLWGDPSDRLGAISVLHTALDYGINFLDTADAYGPHSNELLIRDALHPYPKELVIATKGGVVRTGRSIANLAYLGSRPYLRQAAHMSARRLGLDHIDLYYLHSAEATDAPFVEQVGTLKELQDEGLIRHIGLSNVTAEQLDEAQSVANIAAVTTRYNIGDRDGEGLLRIAERDGLPFSPWFPTAIPAFIGSSVGPGAAANPGEILLSMARAHDATPAQMALAWLLHRSPVMLPIPGTGSLAHLKENTAAASIKLSSDEVTRLTSELGVEP